MLLQLQDNLNLIKVLEVKTITVQQYLFKVQKKLSYIKQLQKQKHQNDIQISQLIEIVKPLENNILYQIKFAYKNYEWKIRRTTKDILGFIDYYLDLEKDHQRITQIKEHQQNLIQEKSHDLNFIQKTIQELFEFCLLESIANLQYNIIHIFLEITFLNFNNFSQGVYYQKYFIKKRQKVSQKLIDSLDVLKKNVKNYRWVIISKEGFGYMISPSIDKLNYSYYEFYSYGMKIEFLDNSIQIKVPNGVLMLESEYTYEYLELVNSLLKGIIQSKVLIKNWFGSFSQITNDNKVKVFANGFEDNYFNDLYESLLNAQKTVYITDSQFSPYIYLQRPIEDYPESRLDWVLVKLAKKGVKIYILLYKENKYLSLYNGSEYVQNYFKQLHNNIMVKCHPQIIIHYWSHHEKQVIIDNSVIFFGGIDLCFGRFETHNFPLKDLPNFYPGNDQEYENKILENLQRKLSKQPVTYQKLKYKNQQKKWFTGQDYYNGRIVDFENVYNYKKSLVKKSQVLWMPWRDIALKLFGDAVLFYSKNFITYWNYDCLQQIQQDRNKTQFQYLNFLHQLADESEVQRLRRIHAKEFQQKTFPARIQGIWSASNWSYGTPQLKPERSIQNAYLRLIEWSKSFIYIENQFFISDTSLVGQQKQVFNQVLKTLIWWIIKAIEFNEDFQVFIVLPMLPGFPGDVKEADGSLLRKQVYWHLKTIFSDKGSLIKTIKQHLISKKSQKKWQDYIKIFGLRNHAFHNGVPQSEIIYVHSKCMIVDDQYMIIGSANLNDWSLMGEWDSELALVIQQQLTCIDSQNESKFNELNQQLCQFQDIDLTTIFKDCFIREDYGIYQGFLQQEIDMQIQINKIATNKGENLIQKYRNDILDSLFWFKDYYIGINRDNFSQEFYKEIDQLIQKYLIDQQEQIKAWLKKQESYNQSKKKYQEKIEILTQLKNCYLFELYNSYYKLIDLVQQRNSLRENIFQNEVEAFDPNNKKHMELLILDTKLNDEFYASCFLYYPQQSQKTLEDIVTIEAEEVSLIKQLFYFKFQKEIRSFQLTYPECFLKNQSDFNNYKTNVVTQILPLEALL